MPACSDCTSSPVVRCGRCSAGRCDAHAFSPGARCDRCEQDYADEATDRRAAKLMFVPSAAILAGGVLFGLMLPITFGGAIGAAIMCAVACAATVGTGLGACRIVDRSARAMFLRERTVGLPPARLLPARHR